MARKPRSRFANFFSFNRYRKRWGSGRASAHLHNTNFDELKLRIIESGSPVYTYGSAKNLSEHLSNLRQEFSGASELLYVHAQLIVLIRREADVASNFKLFEQLWAQEEAFLLQHLNTRWLVAAADTFADNSSDMTVKAICLNVASLINTIKAYESERFVTHAQRLPVDETQLKKIQTERTALGDGTSALAIGTDDTLRNMRWRLDKVVEYNHPSAQILQTVFARIQTFDTVYHRLKLLHRRDRTAWW